MTDKETAAELMMHLRLHQSVAAEISAQFGDDCAATHVLLARSYSDKLLEMGVDERLLEPTKTVN